MITMTFPTACHADQTLISTKAPLHFIPSMKHVQKYGYDVDVCKCVQKGLGVVDTRFVSIGRLSYRRPHS